jgi:hypothetical protein
MTSDRLILQERAFSLTESGSLLGGILGWLSQVLSAIDVSSALLASNISETSQ